MWTWSEPIAPAWRFGRRRRRQTIRRVSTRGVAQLGSAPDWGSGGRGFKSPLPDQFFEFKQSP
jgi:hypothetical protein